jgi:hypothetical protein
MIDFADKADFVVDPGYYRGRCGYFSAAADFMRSIPGVQSWVPSDVLEVGAYKVPLVVDCDTLDVRTWIEEPTYQHDAGIGLPEIHQWTGSPPSATQLVRSSVAPLDRIVCLYDLRA